MSEVIQWFETRPDDKETWRLVKIVLATDVVFLAIFTVASYFSGDLAKIIDETRAAMGDRLPSVEQVRVDWTRIAEYAVAWVFVGGLIAPMTEEFFFRLLPLSLAIFLFGWSQVTKPLIILAACVAGIAFGLAHLGNEGATLSSVLFIQGISGIWLGLLFAKVSGLRGSGVWRAYRVTVFTHAAWNIVVLPILMLLFALTLTLMLSV